MPSFSEYFKLPKNGKFEFFDIPLESDLEAFICPFLIANNKNNDKRIGKIYLQLKSFFIRLNRTFIIHNNRKDGLLFLSHLHELNYYHLGYSDNNKGRAVSNDRAQLIFDSLSRNKLAVQSTLTITNEAHNVLLLVEGIGQDIMSDIISNVCLNIFAEFTIDVCRKYNISNTKQVKLDFFDLTSNKWQSRLFNLPHFNNQIIILVPKGIVSGKREYSERYSYFISKNYISKGLLNGSIKSSMIKTLFRTNIGNKEKKAIIKRIHQIYKKPKRELVDFVLSYNKSLLEFLEYAKIHYPELEL
jgi:hypothetical protein